MIQQIIAKLPMRNKIITKAYYGHLGFEDIGEADYDDYLLLSYGQLELHFFKHKTLNIQENDGQIYLRVNGIESLYSSFIENGISIHPNGLLQTKPWAQKEFSLLDPDNNLLTFGEGA